ERLRLGKRTDTESAGETQGHSDSSLELGAITSHLLVSSSDCGVAARSSCTSSSAVLGVNGTRGRLKTKLIPSVKMGSSGGKGPFQVVGTYGSVGRERGEV